MLDASKTVDFKAILDWKSSAHLGWMNFVMVEKLNNNSLLMAHGENDKMLNVHTIGAR
jgi:hypothetical protein